MELTPKEISLLKSIYEMLYHVGYAGNNRPSEKVHTKDLGKLVNRLTGGK